MGGPVLTILFTPTIHSHISAPKTRTLALQSPSQAWHWVPWAQETCYPSCYSPLLHVRCPQPYSFRIREGGGTRRQTTHSLTTVEETAHKAGNGHGCSVMHIPSCRAIRIELWGLHQACNLHAGGEVGREIFTAAGGARLNDPPCEGWWVCHAARACAARCPCVYWACAARVGRWC